MKTQLTDAHLKSNISRWLLLLSIILQNMEFRSYFGFGTFFYTPCICYKNAVRAVARAKFERGCKYSYIRVDFRRN